MEGNPGGPELGDPTTYHWAWVAGQTVNKLELEAVGLVGVVKKELGKLYLGNELEAGKGPTRGRS